MPKNKVKTTPVNKKVFMKIIELKGTSIRKLGAELEWNEKTIRRNLKDGRMQPKLLDAIARHIDVDPKLLSGELIKKADNEKNEYSRYLLSTLLRHIDDYPYFAYEQRKLFKSDPNGDETTKRVLDFFNISMTQYQDLGISGKYNLRDELLEAAIPVICKYFDYDAYGEDIRMSSDYILQSITEYHKEIIYAETYIRDDYMKNPPEGLTKDKIEKMSATELFDYAMELGDKEVHNSDNDPIALKYSEYLFIEEDDSDEDIERKQKEFDSRNNKE